VAPLLCIEILSPEDRLSRTLIKCQAFFRLGTPECWIFNPEQRSALVLRPDGTMTTHHEGSLTLAGTAISVPLAGIFAVLDEE
jgi:Uma2 family endonuclease